MKITYIVMYIEESVCVRERERERERERLMENNIKELYLTDITHSKVL